MTQKINLLRHLKSDFASGLVVFLVALPLCLGIAMASGAPLFSGIISGVIGGVVVGFLSTSHLSVSGPAAGLTAIVLTAITELGAFDIFLTAVFIAGMIQVLLGFLKAGSLSHYMPNNVIEGMLAGIGVIIILKQLPHALGYDADFEGDEAFLQADGTNSLSAIFELLNYVQLGSILIAGISLWVMIFWENFPGLKQRKVVPGALVAVVLSVLLNEWFTRYVPSLAIQEPHLVRLPIAQSWHDFQQMLVLPRFAAWTHPQVWVVGLTIAIVASIETLLCIEAADRMDVHKRMTHTNAELQAQGLGNMISALLGGLPMTSVVVRTSANSNAGAKTKMSTIIHGFLLLVSVLLIPTLLNKIPLATLASILLLVGYKLAKPSLILHFWSRGKYQFIPFMATLLAVVLTDLLQGVALGLIISVVFVLKGNLKRAYHFRKESYQEGDIIHIDLAQEVSFLNKAAIKSTLYSIPEHAHVVINAHDTVYIAHDILDLIREFKSVRAQELHIKVKLKGFKKSYQLEDTEDGLHPVVIEHPDKKNTDRQNHEQNFK